MEKDLDNDKAIIKVGLSVIQYLCIATPAMIFLIEEDTIPLNTTFGVIALAAAVTTVGIEYMKRRV